MASIVPPRPGGSGIPARSSAPTAARRTSATADRPPSIPLAIILISLLAAVAFIAIASGDQAGGTSEISIPAVAAWFCGSIVGLVGYSWFRTENAKRRMSRNYSETALRLPLIALGASVAGWIVGSYAAVVVAQSIARR